MASATWGDIAPNSSRVAPQPSLYHSIDGAPPSSKRLASPSLRNVCLPPTITDRAGTEMHVIGPADKSPRMLLDCVRHRLRQRLRASRQKPQAIYRRFATCIIPANRMLKWRRHRDDCSFLHRVEAMTWRRYGTTVCTNARALAHFGWASFYEFSSEVFLNTEQKLPYLFIPKSQGIRMID